MKSLKKGILALALTLGIVASVGGGSVFAAYDAFGVINGHMTHGNSYCTSYSSHSRTEYFSTGQASVSSEYTYLNKNTLVMGKKISSKRNSIAVVDLYIYAPTNCKSVGVASTHTVNASGQTWSGTTTYMY